MNDAATLQIKRPLLQRMSGVVALISLIVLAVSFYFLPGVKLTSLSFALALGLGLIFFTLYVTLPQMYLNETLLMVGDIIYVSLITYMAWLAGDYGVLLLFLYFVVIVADALKYPLPEYVIVVVYTTQAAFFYILLWAPVDFHTRLGIFGLFAFSIISLAIFVWYFASQVIHERSLRFVLEKKGRYLKAMNDNLQAADQMRTSIMSVTSHEFLTPLSVVKGSLQVLNNEKMDKLTPRQLHYLKVALKGNQLAINLVNDLLSMTRIDSGKWQLQPQPVDLTAVVNELVEEFQPARQEKQLRLTAHLPQAEVKVKADRKLLRIAIKNLVDNAIKYTLSGSVTVAIEVSDEIRVEVADTGIGVKEISRPDLFQKFTRSDEAIHASPNGFGIGLYYSRAIIRQHGGDITFKPNSPAGSVFSIHLPLTALIK